MLIIYFYFYPEGRHTERPERYDDHNTCTEVKQLLLSHDVIHDVRTFECSQMKQQYSSR